MREVVITSACRTPIGSFRGSLSGLTATRLGAAAIRAAVERSGLTGSDVSEVLMGNVLGAGLGQAPARQAALGAGLPTSVPCTTVNKVCGSGLKAVMLGAQAVMLGDAEIVVAGGMESMSNAPYILDKARGGYRMGNAELIDCMVKDGLLDAYKGVLMGDAGELCARECGISREAQDAFAVRSYTLAREAGEKGFFREEIVPVTVPRGKEETVVAADEEPPNADFARIPRLKPVFAPDGTITAANASKISDGAAALVIMGADTARSRNIRPLARILGFGSTAKDPVWFTTAPADVVRAVLARCGLTEGDVDLFEINEAFAVVALAVQRILGLDTARLNVHGGAIALGHPLGASGARVLVTLVHALRLRQGRRGVAALCIGGGEASGMALERFS
ncbi:MAG: thiolase family protein [Bacteroidota bacterium]